MKERDQTTQLSRVGHRAHRCAPFLVVAFCFLLPFFSLSSCGSGQVTTATGADIVTGSKLIRQQTTQPMFGHTELGPVGPDTEAQAASRAARPWAICLLALLMIGTVAAFLVEQHQRGALGSIAALCTVALWLLLASASGVPSRDDFHIGGGAVVAFLTLLVTTVWYIAAAMVVFTRPASRKEPTPLTS